MGNMRGMLRMEAVIGPCQNEVQKGKFNLTRYVRTTKGVRRFHSCYVYDTAAEAREKALRKGDTITSYRES